MSSGVPRSCSVFSRLPVALRMLGLLGLLLTACTSDGTGVPRPDYVIQATVGSGGPAVAGEALPVAIRVTSSGRPAADVDVRLEPSHGSVSPVQGRTDGAGELNAQWTVGAAAGPQSLQVRVGDDRQIALSATVVAGPPAALRLSNGEVQFAALRDSVRLSAWTDDRFGNEIEPVTPAWTSLDPAVASVAPSGRLTSRGRGVTRVVATLAQPGGELSDTVVVKVAPRGVITLTFDDGWKSTITRAFPLLAQHGLRANVGVVTGSITWPSFLNLQDLQTLHQAGWSIVSHSVTHSLLTDLPPDDLERELTESQAWIRAQGFAGSSVFVVPYHGWGERERTAIRRHYRAARGLTLNQFGSDSIVEWRPVDPYEITGYEAEFAPLTTEEGRQRIEAHLQRVIEEGRFLDIFFHDITDELLEGFSELVKILARYEDWIHPYHELFPDSAAP